MRGLDHVGFLVVHCAASKPENRITVDDLRRWHVEENGWDDIGYHYFVDLDGAVHECRDTNYQGAHEPKANSMSIAICLEGGYGGDDTYPEHQLFALFKHLLHLLRDDFPNAAVVGHNNFRSDKSCPNFDVQLWFNKMLSEYSIK